MAATKADIKKWLESAIKEGCTHLLVVCDTFDHEDYPVKVYSKDRPLIDALRESAWLDVSLAVKHYHGPNMQRVMEVYDLSKDIETQLKMGRAGQEFLQDELAALVQQELGCSPLVAEALATEIRVEAKQSNISQSAAKVIVYAKIAKKLPMKASND